MHARHLIMMAFAIAFLSPVAATVGTGHDQHVGHEKQSANAPLLQAVRDATERFKDVNAAMAEGYARFQGCVSGPEQGAMGVHYSNSTLFDDVIDVTKPEVLVYEPRNGRLDLVAVEYVTPADAWNATHTDADRPEVMGQLFHFAPGPNRYGPIAFYELHAWAWKDNPNGAFADWNPRVSCEEWSPGREF
jgi:hypothetical protein